MIVKQYIKDFEKLGFGMFVHYGLYSLLGSGEWTKQNNQVSDEDYEALTARFNPDPDWAERLARTAERAGCKYITLTARHHDGFSLFDMHGRNTYDSVHSLCGRDLVAEFTAACRRHGLIPFLYHTLIDWHEKTYEQDFRAYLQYLRDSVELLCTNYGKIGGFWFDGMWSSPDSNWEEDALYGLIRKYQPDAMIINNTGMSERGKLGHIELDSVTFERGKPLPINLADSPKYIASEMCEIFADHWGYARDDLNYKAPSALIRALAQCRGCGSNFLLNVGPMPDGRLTDMDQAHFGIIGRWMDYFSEAVYEPRPTAIPIQGKEHDFILRGNGAYYLFCFDLPMAADPHVALFENGFYEDTFRFEPKIKSVSWLDNGKTLEFTQSDGTATVRTEPFAYGRNLVVRVAKIICE